MVTGGSVIARAAWCGLAVALAFGGRVVETQRYTTGQTIAAVFEGWERRTDGSFDMVFGYMNRNYEEVLDIPVGPNNRLEPGEPDRGQPTYFFPRRQQFMFKVRVPKDWGEKDLVWTLTHRGHTEKAFGTLKPFWEIDNSVYHQNRSGPGPQGAANAGPSITLVGAAQRTIPVGAPLPLVVEVTDDGLPPPRVARGGGGGTVTPESAARGRGAAMPPAVVPLPQNPIIQMAVRLEPGMRLGTIWVLHRRTGTGNVKFDPSKVAVVDGRASATAVFSEPGQYVIRGYADDGILLDYVDVRVEVTR